MRVESFVLSVVAAMAFVVSMRPAVAATADINLQCYDSVTAFTDYSLFTETDTSPNLVSFSGIFAAGADSELQCQFVVPSDYENASLTEPSVTLVGYARDCVGCSGGACSTTKKVKFKVSSKALSPGFGIGGWSAEDSDEESYTSVSCGATCVTTTCYQDDEIRSFTADATNDASGWLPGDVVVIRVLRDTSVTDNLGSTFLVAGFRLTYPLD